MERQRRHGGRAVVLGFAVLATLGGAAAPARAAVVPGEVIVRYAAGVSAAERAEVRADVDAASARALPLPRAEVLRLEPGQTVAAAVAVLARRGDVALAQPNYLYVPEAAPNDTLFASQYALHNVGQSGGTPDADIDAPEAWEVSVGSDSIVIGIVDTGVNVNHPDLAPNIDSRGRDFFGADDSVVDDDYAEHGTFVAGVAAARGNNGQGMSGVAQRAKILPLQADNGNGLIDTVSVVEAVTYARSAGARIVNMSFGSFGPADPGDQAIQGAIEASPAILFTTSAGNLDSLTDLPNDNDNPSRPHWPSNLSKDHANVISVAGTTRTDALSTTSSFGATTVDLAAPGGSVLGAAAMTTVSDQRFDDPLTPPPALPTDWSDNGTWETTSARTHSSPNSLTDSPAGNYAANSNTSVTSAGIAVPAGTTACSLFYRLRRRLAAGDFLRPEMLVNVGVFTALESVTGSSAGDGFEARTVGSPVPSGATVSYRFRLTSDATGEDEGVHVDNTILSCNQPNPAAFATGSGTSFAAPAVAGAAAVLLGRNSALTPAQLKTALMATVDPVAGLSGKTVTGGRLKLDRAVRSVSGPSPAPAQPSVPEAQPVTPAPLGVQVPDVASPVVGGARVAPFAFLPLRAGATVRAAATRRGAALRFRVSEPSTVRLRVLRPRAGRRVGRRCVAPTRANRRRERCGRYVLVGTGAVPGTVTGRVTRTLSGRLRGRALRPGPYRLELVATDAAGNRSLPVFVGFRIATK
jgi:thermitase